jgi:hypothetical protein
MVDAEVIAAKSEKWAGFHQTLQSIVQYVIVWHTSKDLINFSGLALSCVITLQAPA